MPCITREVATRRIKMRAYSPIVEHCCFCVSLRTGSLSYAYVTLVWYVLFGIGSIVLFGFGVSWIEAPHGMVRDVDEYVYTVITTISLSTTLPLSISGTIFSAMLINGIHKVNASLMIPWIALQVLSTIGTVTSAIATSVLVPCGATIGFSVAFAGFAILIEITGILVVTSHVQEILKSKVPPVDHYKYDPDPRPAPQVKHPTTIQLAACICCGCRKYNDPPRLLERWDSNMDRQDSVYDIRPSRRVRY